MSDHLNAALNGLDLALDTLATPAGGLINPAVPIAAALADRWLELIQRNIVVYEAATGETLDMDRLKSAVLFTQEEIDAAKVQETLAGPVLDVGHHTVHENGTVTDDDEDGA
jgi:hypothetical protein